MRSTEAMVDTNILVYAHNRASPFFETSRRLLKTLIDGDGFCVTPLILLEFFSVVTNGRKVEVPLSAETAHATIEDMLGSGVIDVLPANLDASFFRWLKKYIGVTKRYQIYDASIAYAMYRNRIARLFTRNVRDFQKFDFIETMDPFRETAVEPAPPKRRFIPYGRQSIDEQDVAAVCRVLRSRWLTTGPAVSAFEESVADFVEARHAVAVSSGTAALHCAMRALGVGPGDEVIVPPMTFAATANAAVYEGAVPVFADVDPSTLLIDPKEVERRITPATKAVVAVDYAGQPCDYDALRSIARKHGLRLVADACHALGARYKGRKVGSLADMTVFSFHPVKHLTTGEGGMVVTDDPELAEGMRRFRNHGITADHRRREELGSWFYEMVELGWNYRITDIQCALGVSQLRKLPGWLERRREIAARYHEAFTPCRRLEVLSVRRDVEHAYHLYVVRLKSGDSGIDRAAVFLELRRRGVGVNVHYIPVHLHPFYRSRFGTGPGDCPEAEKAYEEIISLPMFPGMSNGDVAKVIETVGEVLRE